MSKKFLSFLMILSLVLLPCCFADALTVTDMAGREITLDAQPTRLVVLSASDCEILYAIGAGDLIVGRGEYCDYPEDILPLPSVESGYETNIEQIIALEPQVVIMTMMAQTVEQNAALENAGIKVIVTNAQTIDDVYTDISLLGTLTGKTENADALIGSMKAEFDKYSAEPTGKKIYFEVSPLEWGLWTAGKGTFMDELASLCGLSNIFGDVEGWASVSEEQVLDRDPDYIITSTDFVNGVAGDEEILSRPAWQDLTAVKNGKVAAFDYNTITRPGPRLTEAAKALSEYVNAE